MAWDTPQPPTDPLTVGNVEEFVGLLQLLRESAHKSYNELASDIVNDVGPIKGSSSSTTHKYLTGSDLPPWPWVAAVLKATKVSEDQIASNWSRAWTRLKRGGGTMPSTALQLKRDIEQLTEELVEERNRVDQLRARAGDLERDLAAEAQTRIALEQEITRLQAALTEAQKRADGLQDALQEKLASRRQEQSKVEIHIQELRAELNVVIDKREQAEVRYARLRNEVATLDDASASIDDLLNLHFDRAEYERRKREQVEENVARLQEQVRSLEQLLGDYQRKMMEDGKRPTETANLPLTNNDITVRLVVADSDFGKRKIMRVRFKWYCVECERGGELPYKECPQRRAHLLLRDYPKEIPFDLPPEPWYGRISLGRQGYFDTPLAPQGEIYVQVVKRDRFRNH